MASVGPWRWQARTIAEGFDGGQGGQFDAMKFVIQIVYPDGTVHWDNGGSNWGHFEVPVPAPRCKISWTPFQTYDSPMESLPVSTVRK